MLGIIMNRAFIARWTRMPHSTGRLSASASLHHSLSLAAFITNIAESDFRHAQASLMSCRCWKRAASENLQMRRPESGLGQTEPLKLQRPFGRRITQVCDADAARKPPFDGRSWRDEGHRYRHVDLTNTALLARGNDAGSI